MAAENPILITGYAGRHARAARMIEELAEFAAIAVYQSFPSHNISDRSPCFAGYATGKAVAAADVGLLVDVDVPWFPADVQPSERAYWAHVDIDVLKLGSPMWTFPGNLRLQGDSGRILEQLLAELQARATPRFKAAVERRLECLKAARAERLAATAKLAGDKGSVDAINLHYVLAEIGRALDENDIVFNEAVSNAGAVMMQIPRPLPNTMFHTGGAGLGWSGGMALGAKLAAPDRMMVQIVGDGSFYFNGPSSVFAVSQQYNLPILSVVLDNSGWRAVKQSTLRVFPDGEAKAANAFEAELAPKVAFAKIAEAFGAYGESVADPAEVPAAIARCVKEVRGGRSALLHARVTRL